MRTDWALQRTKVTLQTLVFSVVKMWEVPMNATSRLLELPGQGCLAYDGEKAWWVWAGAEGGGHCHSQTGRPWQRMRAFFTLKGLVSLVRGVWIDGHQEFNIIRASKWECLCNFILPAGWGWRWDGKDRGAATFRTLLVWSEFCRECLLWSLLLFSSHSCDIKIWKCLDFPAHLAKDPEPVPSAPRPVVVQSYCKAANPVFKFPGIIPCLFHLLPGKAIFQMWMDVITACPWGVVGLEGFSGDKWVNTC